MINILKGMVQTLRTMVRRPVTYEYPEVRRPLPQRTRGIPALLWDDELQEDKCTGCEACARICPTDCIFVTAKLNPHYPELSKVRRLVDVFELDTNLCIYCALCVEVCPFDAIEMSYVHEVPGGERGTLLLDRGQLLALPTKSRNPGPQYTPSRAELARIRDKVDLHVPEVTAEGAVTTTEAGAGSATATAEKAE